MNVCRKCGHEFGTGRFCTNCGHPVAEPVIDDGPDWRTGTAERPAVPDVEHRHAAPREPRGPLGWLPWVLAAVVLVLVAGLGGWLLLGGDDSPEPPVAADPTSSTTPPESPAPSQTPEPTDEPEQSQEPDGPTDVARSATASAPETAPPNEDVSGNLVRYEARNMLDGVPETCWRMPGDGTGQTLTFQLAEDTTLTEVGLINGYAKVAQDGAGQPLDWYAGNRRITEVEWTFDDGTTVTQDLEDTRVPQTTELDGVTTRTVQLRLVSVSAPGKGRAARNYTPVSDVLLIGTPA